MRKEPENSGVAAIDTRSGRGGRRFESYHSDHTYEGHKARVAQVAAQLAAYRAGKSAFPAGSTAPARGTVATPIPEIGRAERLRFWAKVQRREPDDCWLWTGAGSAQGYGRFKIKGKLFLSHRVAYTLGRGPIPHMQTYHGMEVMHSCDNPACCNPAHLKLGTNSDNMRDMVAKDRHPQQLRPGFRKGARS